jgi:hypothetical protein
MVARPNRILCLQMVRRLLFFAESVLELRQDIAAKVEKEAKDEDEDEDE